jgi:hypothetical protein
VGTEERQSSLLTEISISGYSWIANYALIFSGAFPATSTDPAPFNKFQIRLLKRVKDVYVGVSLLTVWNTVNNLKKLVGDPPLPAPGFADWSFRRDMVGFTGVQRPDGSISRRDVAAFISDTPPADVPPSLFISFSNLLSV